MRPPRGANENLWLWRSAPALGEFGKFVKWSHGDLARSGCRLEMWGMASRRVDFEVNIFKDWLLKEKWVCQAARPGQSPQRELWLGDLKACRFGEARQCWGANSRKYLDHEEPHFMGTDWPYWPSSLDHRQQPGEWWIGKGDAKMAFNALQTWADEDEWKQRDGLEQHIVRKTSHVSWEGEVESNRGFQISGLAHELDSEVTKTRKARRFGVRGIGNENCARRHLLMSRWRRGLAGRWLWYDCLSPRFCVCVCVCGLGRRSFSGSRGAPTCRGGRKRRLRVTGPENGIVDFRRWSQARGIYVRVSNTVKRAGLRGWAIARPWMALWTVRVTERGKQWMQTVFVNCGCRRKKGLILFAGDVYTFLLREEANAEELIFLQKRKKNNGNISHYFIVTFVFLQDESIMLSFWHCYTMIIL